MSSLPRPRRRPQGPQSPRGPHPEGLRESLLTKALRLAVQLTPFQRSLVARAGLPRWLELPQPFTPHPGRQRIAAFALATPEYGVLEPVPNTPLAFQLTALGELVAGLWLTAVLWETEPGAPEPFSPLQSC